MRSRRDILARRLRTARVNAGLTQAQVAARLGLHRPAISEVEAGRRSVSTDELELYSRLYRVPVAELLNARSATEQAIRRMARIIAQRFQPELIILFGSHARGNAGPDSDVDLLVVMDPQGSHRQKAAEIGAALHEIPVPKDIIVTAPEEFAWRQHVMGTIEHPAAREGRVLYARR